MDIADAKRAVSEVGWLAGKPRPFAEAFLASATLRSLPKGGFAHHVGDPPGSFYGIAAGALLFMVPVMTRGLEYGHLALPGQWMGLTAAVSPVERQVSFEAATDSILLLVSPANILELVMQSKDSARHVLSLVLSNQLLSIRSGADLLIANPRRRLAARLLTLSGLKLNEAAPAQSKELPLTQGQLAAMSNLSRNSVNRLLAEFEVAGLCQRRYAGIYIPNLKSLEGVLDEDGSA